MASVPELFAVDEDISSFAGGIEESLDEYLVFLETQPA